MTTKRIKALLPVVIEVQEHGQYANLEITADVENPEDVTSGPILREGGDSGKIAERLFSVLRQVKRPNDQ